MEQSSLSTAQVRCVDIKKRQLWTGPKKKNPSNRGTKMGQIGEIGAQFGGLEVPLSAIHAARRYWIGGRVGVGAVGQ